METKKTSVTLMSWTKYPVETIYCEWQLSRTDGPIPAPLDVSNRILDERHLIWQKNGERWNKSGEPVTLPPGLFESEVRKVFEDCISMKLPLSETLDFVFAIEHCPIALREQMVRHRVGHKFGGQLGADLIPDLVDSTFWAQTMRVKDMGTFATEGEYLEPEWLKENGEKPIPEGWAYEALSDEQISQGLVPRKIPANVRQFYHTQMKWIQQAYRRLIKAGMPAEDARNLLPLGCQHRLTWKVNLSALMHVLSKRSCWIAQLGMWKPVIHGMVTELATKVDPFFRRLVDPPCIGKDGEFEACRFSKENENRLPGGIDPYPPCSLWVNHDGNNWRNGPTVQESKLSQYDRMSREFSQLWGRDPNTGKRIQLSW